MNEFDKLYKDANKMSERYYNNLCIEDRLDIMDVTDTYHNYVIKQIIQNSYYRGYMDGLNKK